MQLYSTKKEILTAIKNGVIFTRNINTNGFGEYVMVTYNNNAMIDSANLRSYKALIADGSIIEDVGAEKPVCSLWNVIEYRARLNN